MAALSGTGGSVLVGTALCGEISEWSLDISHSPVETTAFGDNWAEYVPSIRNATGSFGGNFDPADTTQTVLINSMLGGSAVALKLYVSGTKYFTLGTAYLTGMSPSINQAGKADVTYAFQNAAPVVFT